jgi:phosphoribosylamine--glycine ligase
MVGEEASLLAFTDGETIVPMISSQDHKRAYDGDQGPNTGGMGTYAPAPVMTDEMVAIAVEKVLKPIVAGMKAEGRPYKGCLYAGLMITEEGPKVVEFNARFGDPETQVVLPLLKSDLAEIMQACCEGNLAQQKIEWSDGAAVCVVLASGGYPQSYEKGKVITGLERFDNADGYYCFHAGTKFDDNGNVVTSGGRVLGVTAVGPTLKDARAAAYEAAGWIHFDGQYMRHDIGKAIDAAE